MGGPNEVCQEMFSQVAENDVVSLTGAQAFISNIRHSADFSKLQTTFEKLKSTMQDLPDGEPDKHSIKINLGKTDQCKTNLDFKVFLDNEEGKTFFDQAVKGLKFTKEQLGVILRFHSSNPSQAKEKLEKLVKMALAVLKNTLLKPNSPEATLVNTLKFEYAADDEAVTLAVHSEHKGIQFLLEYISIFWKRFNIEKIRGKAHIEVALYNDLHKITSEIQEDRDIITLLKEGGFLKAELNTNADALLKRVLRPKNTYDLEGPLLIFLMFLQKNSRVEIGADEVDLNPFQPKNAPQIVPVVDLFQENGPIPLNEIKGGLEGVLQMKMPIVENALDLVENYLLANVQISVNTPHLLASLHFKTSGIKEIWTKVKNL